MTNRTYGWGPGLPGLIGTIVVITDLGPNGTITLTLGNPALTDNGDDTITLSLAAVVDNGDGTSHLELGP